MLYKRSSRNLDTFTTIRDCQRRTFSTPTALLTPDSKTGNGAGIRALTGAMPLDGAEEQKTPECRAGGNRLLSL
jgi:hypothetical protein